jgi:hypothetical protein
MIIKITEIVPAMERKKSMADLIATGISLISTSHFLKSALLIPRILSAADAIPWEKRNMYTRRVFKKSFMKEKVRNII